MSAANTPESSQLGRDTAYPSRYDAGLLFPIPRQHGRAALGIDEQALPFIGCDRWHAYELSWLDARGKPQVATATFQVPADSPRLIESKSFKLYLNGFNSERISGPAALQARIEADLSAAAGAAVSMAFGLPPTGADGGNDTRVDLDAQAITIDSHGPPDATLLQAEAGGEVEETLSSALLKSNCPVTGQPDWASIDITYRGPRIDRAGLLRYLVGFREHCEFHEQCVERIFSDVLARCRPQSLSVWARYTRRGGLDINPWRATPDRSAPAWHRDARQ
ncbi:MAG: NADPH-dependent 7-cyano-7-deazaguanine reductase QueF [Pseudoxanthomonas suwonensis]|nr:NADPH-dependent 7-cyano-7-deazaguanine reductase QueF [Pseudoxanthomonas suwonensis]